MGLGCCELESVIVSIAVFKVGLAGSALLTARWGDYLRLFPTFYLSLDGNILEECERLPREAGDTDLTERASWCRGHVASRCLTYLQARPGLVHVPPAQYPHLVM